MLSRQSKKTRINKINLRVFMSLWPKSHFATRSHVKFCHSPLKPFLCASLKTVNA